MRRAALIAAAFFSVIGDAAAGSILTPKEQAIFANLLAEDFSAVCIRTDARLTEVEAIAKRRGWKSRPVELFGGYRPSLMAWEGEVRHLSFGRGVERTRMAFVVAVGGQESPSGRECTFLSNELGFDVLKAGLKNQGFELNGDFDWSDELGYEHRGAGFCSPELISNAKTHDIELETRRIPGRVQLNGSRLLFVRDSSLSPSICPQTIRFGSSGPGAQLPPIEPWLGQKPDALPPPVDEAVTVDGE